MCIYIYVCVCIYRFKKALNQNSQGKVYKSKIISTELRKQCITEYLPCIVLESKLSNFKASAAILQYLKDYL